MDPDLDSVPLYQYRPLRDGEIRVLYIKPGHPNDPIECVLRHGVPKGIHESPDWYTGADGNRACGERPPPFPPEMPLEDAVPWLHYGALSYAWGTTYNDGSHFTHAISCEGSRIRVTATLHGFLRKARQAIRLDWPYPPPLEPLSSYYYGPPCLYPLWIDAICINQNDPVERSSQVRIMPKIFSNAVTLLVWLGDVSDDETQSLAEAVRHRISNPAENPQGAHKKALTQLMRRTWFQRRWVLQEYKNGQMDRCHVFIGDIELKARDFEVVTNSRNTQPDEAAFLPQHLGDREFLWRTLLWNLHVYDKAKCSDSRDLVYALVHISSDFRSRTFPVDYSKPAEQVFRDAAESALMVSSSPSHPGGTANESSDVIGLLALATTRMGYGHRNERNPYFPSWVPDWRIETSYACPEHRKAISSMVASFSGPRSPLATARVVRDGLVIEGEVVTICFPFHHIDGKAGQGNCRCCQLFNGWSTWSQELKWRLCEGGQTGGEVIFVPRTMRSSRVPKFPPDNGVAFVLVCMSGMSYEPRYCFRFTQPQPFEPAHSTTVCII